MINIDLEEFTLEGLFTLRNMIQLEIDRRMEEEFEEENES